MSNPDQRDLLRARIEAAQHRNASRDLAEQARQAADTARDFVRQHPLATVTGVVVIGLAIGAMTKRGRSVGRAAGSRANKWVGYAVELGLAYAATALENAGDAARKGQDKLEDISDTVGDRARSLKREASHRAGDAHDTARRVTREIGKQTARKVRDLKSRAKG